MERVTEYTRFHGGMLAVLKNSNRYSAIERLATIEDILGDDYDLDHLRKLVEADRIPVEAAEIALKGCEHQ